jgi:hypothetical protein
VYAGRTIGAEHARISGDAGPDDARVRAESDARNRRFAVFVFSARNARVVMNGGDARPTLRAVARDDDEPQQARK